MNSRQEMMAPAAQQGSEDDGRTAPMGGQVIVALATAALFGGLGIADGGIEPGGYAFVGVAVWFTVVLIAVLGRGQAGRLPRGAYLGAGLLFALAMLAGLSATWSGDAGASVDIAVRSALYAAILIAAVLAVSAGAGRAMLAGLAIGGLAIVAVALAGRLIAGELAPSDIEEIRQTAGGRLTSPVGYWNGLGVTAGIAAVTLLWLGSHEGAARRRAAATAFAVPAILALGMTSSRGAAIGLLGGAAVLALASPQRGRVIGAGVIAALAALPAFLLYRASDGLRLGLENSAANTAGIVAIVLLIAGMALAYRLVASFDGRLTAWRPAVPGARALAVIGIVCAGLLALAVATTAGDDTDVAITPGEEAGEIARQSDSFRVSYWESALDAWSSDVVNGVGAGGFHIWWLSDPGEPQPVTHAHSVVFQMLSEFGLVGFVLTFAFLALVAAVGVIRVRAPSSTEVHALVAAGLGLLVVVGLPALVDWTWSIPVAMTGLLAGAALTLGVDGGGRVASAGKTTAPILIVAIAGLAFSASTYVRVTEVENARAALADLDYQGAIKAAERADRWAPWSAEGLEHEAAALSADGRHGPAATRLREAIDRAPKNWLLWFEAGRVAEARGAPAEANRLYDEAERLNDFLEVERPKPAARNERGRN